MDRTICRLSAAAAAGVLLCCAGHAFAQGRDMYMTNITNQGLTQVGIRAMEAGDPAPTAVGNPIVGLTFSVTLTNVGQLDVPWHHPVYEMGPDATNPVSTNPWISALRLVDGRGFTGPDGPPHPHTYRWDMVPGAPAHPATVAGGDPGGPSEGHPHYTFYVFRKRAPQPNDPPFTTTIIGRSDLKHAYVSGPPLSHYSSPATPFLTDTYSARSNEDQSMFGPISEMTLPSFALPRHDHMGSEYAGLNLPGVAAPFLHRDHGELDRTGEPDPANPGMMRLRRPGDGLLPAVPAQGPADQYRDHSGATNIDHLLQVYATDINPAINPPGTRWFVGAAAWVVGDDHVWNNFRSVEFIPTLAVGGNFTFAFRTNPDGTLFFDREGVFNVPMFDPTTDLLLNRLVPAPGAGSVLALMGTSLLFRRRRT